MNAKEFLAQKGVHNLDTKKRYNEVIAWMEEYAALRHPLVVGRSEQFCSCSFVMIMRDVNTDVPFCAECGKRVNEQN